METVTLKALYHRKDECIGIYFKHSITLNDIVKKIPKVKWSKTTNCWYVPCTKEYYEHIVKALDDKAILQTSELKSYLHQRKALLPATQKINEDKPAINLTNPLCEENIAAFTNYKTILLLKAYSPSTVKTYCNEFRAFLQALKQIPAANLETKHIQRYILYCINTLHLQENTIHSRMNALKFYYEQVL